MESIKKLRDFLKGTQLWRSVDFSSVDFRLDEIKREIAERFMLLPVDADGVPIRPGDKLIDDDCVFTVESIIAFSDHCKVNGHGVDKDGLYCDLSTAPCRCIHFKTRTVEDVLRDYCVDIAHQLEADPDKTISESTIADYADRIRQAVKS